MLSVPRTRAESVIPLQPLDRLLFGHNQRTYEGIVRAVSTCSAKVTVRTFKPPTRKTRRNYADDELNLKNVKTDANFQLFSLFRGSIDTLPPSGHYVEFTQRDLWLDPDDLVELTVQGARYSVDRKTSNIVAPTWIARVNTVRATEALVDCWPNATNPLHAHDRPPAPPSMRTPHLSEWVPRNTLRFIRFIRRAAPPPPVRVKFEPAIFSAR